MHKDTCREDYEIRLRNGGMSHFTPATCRELNISSADGDSETLTYTQDQEEEFMQHVALLDAERYRADFIAIAHYEHPDMPLIALSVSMDQTSYPPGLAVKLLQEFTIEDGQTTDDVRARALVREVREDPTRATLVCMIVRDGEGEKQVLAKTSKSLLE